MARDLNKVMLIGRLGSDPEARTTPNGSLVVTFSLATGDSYKDKNTGQTVEKTEWHRIVVWDKLGEVCRQYLHKGSLVYVEGRLQTRSWDDKETGKKNYITEIVCTDMQILTPKSQSQNDKGGQMPPAPPPSAYEEMPTSSDSTASAFSSKHMPEAPSSEPKSDDLPF
ncbi:MAG: single-stranded DNA-binding protein [Chloroherpetonaceae bacterium]